MKLFPSLLDVNKATHTCNNENCREVTTIPGITTECPKCGEHKLSITIKTEIKGEKK